MPESPSAPRPHHLRDAWLEWKQTVLPEGLDPELVDRVRSAYYFGAIALHEILMEAMTSKEQPEPGKPNILDEVQAEFEDFENEVPDWFREQFQ